MCQKACYPQPNRFLRFLPFGIIQADRVLKPASGLPEEEAVKKQRSVAAPVPVPVPEKKKRWQDILIKELGLPDKTKAVLIRNGITRAKKVENMGDEELMGLRGISQKSLKKIRKAIKKIKRQTIDLV
jgi:DNA-directed RNA polymerase alpha subunit